MALRELNLSWNNLRQESAAAIGRSLSLNRGLVSLNLAHNAFNDLPSQEIGDSLRANGTLQVHSHFYVGPNIPNTTAANIDTTSNGNSRRAVC